MPWRSRRKWRERQARLESLMFGVTTSDMTTLIASATLLIAIAVSAAVVPARRAVRVDPIIALRAE